MKGKTPRAASTCGRKYLRRAAVNVGVIPKNSSKRFGWHNLRHSLATFLGGNDVNLPVIQSILRHKKPTTTAKYTHGINSVQVAAQGKFLDALGIG